MSLGDRLDELKSYPKASESQFVPRTEFDGVSGFLQTGPLKQAPNDHAELLTQFGYDPDKVRIVGHPKVSKWQQRARIRGTSEYETTWLSAFKFTISSVEDTKPPTDLDAIVREIEKDTKA